MKMSDGNLITSKDLIEKTGISRATLNNYIKSGILPKPIVRRPGPEQKGVKQIGYFPASVLENILKVKLLKQQGNSMDEIAAMFQEGSADEIEEIAASEIENIPAGLTEYTQDKTDHPAEVVAPLEPVAPQIQHRETAESPRVADTYKAADTTRAADIHRAADTDLRVTIADISSPAYLVNHNFEIEWINKPAEDLIFNCNIKPMVDIESRNVFRLLLNEKLRRDHSHLERGPASSLNGSAEQNLCKQSWILI